MDLETAAAGLDLEAIARYRRDGYLVVRQVLSRSHVADCLAALTALAEGLEPDRRDASGAFIALEPDADAASVARADLIRKFGDFTDASPALRRAAMSARLHAVLDALMGQGRVMLQEMALVKPPRVSGEKPWHQDAAYFRGSDPDLMFGVWIALDPATRDNGCMEVVPGSHRLGPAPHVPAEDINLCTIRPDLVARDSRIALPMEPGDVLVFHSLIHHYTAANRTDQRRRALQFHYYQVGLEWTSLEAHRALFHDADGAYAGCTVPKGAPFAETSSFVPGRLRPVVPMA
ncbi:MAG: phytanoyl-CoA dioxygenase family protein [Acetobacteraceae bacterium]